MHRERYGSELTTHSKVHLDPDAHIASSLPRAQHCSGSDGYSSALIALSDPKIYKSIQTDPGGSGRAGLQCAVRWCTTDRRRVATKKSDRNGGRTGSARVVKGWTDGKVDPLLEREE